MKGRSGVCPPLSGVLFFLVEQVAEWAAGIGVGRIFGIELQAGKVTPVFVHPQPALGFLADVGFEVIPYGLGHGGGGGVVGGLECFELEMVAAVVKGGAEAGDDGNVDALGEAGVKGGDAGFESKTLDDRSGFVGFEGEVGKQGDVPAAFKLLHEAQHGTLLRDDTVSAVLTQAREDGGEGGVFEVLGDHDEGEAAEAHEQTDEFEIAEVGGDPDGTFFSGHGFRLRGVGMVMNQTFDVVPVEAQGPEQVEKGAGEGLVGGDGDAACLIGGDVLTGEGGLEVGDGGGATAVVDEIGDEAEDLGKQNDGGTGQLGQQPGGEADESGFQGGTKVLHVCGLVVAKMRLD